MGLDFVDLTCRIEETFGIELSHDEVRGAVRHGDLRVGDLYELVLKELGMHDRTRNDYRLNEFVWNEVQQLLSRSIRRSAHEIELGMPLTTLFPIKTRRAAWSDLRRRSPYRVPELDYPLGVRTAGVALSLAMVITEIFQIWRVPGVRWFWPLLGVIGFWMVGETNVKVLPLFSRFRKRFPRKLVTVKDLCRVVLAANYQQLCTAAHVAYDARCLSVWNSLSRIIVQTLGVQPTDVTFQSHLVRDLGMN